MLGSKLIDVLWDLQSDAREQFLDQAKVESALTINEDEEPFRDAVESGQTIGEATTQLQFGANDGESADEVIARTSKELFEQKSHGKRTCTEPSPNLHHQTFFKPSATLKVPNLVNNYFSRVFFHSPSF